MHSCIGRRDGERRLRKQAIQPVRIGRRIVGCRDGPGMGEEQEQAQEQAGLAQGGIPRV
jgi:hypothetical protein